MISNPVDDVSSAIGVADDAAEGFSISPKSAAAVKKIQGGTGIVAGRYATSWVFWASEAASSPMTLSRFMWAGSDCSCGRLFRACAPSDRAQKQRPGSGFFETPRCRLVRARLPSHQILFSERLRGARNLHSSASVSCARAIPATSGPSSMAAARSHHRTDHVEGFIGSSIDPQSHEDPVLVNQAPFSRAARSRDEAGVLQGIAAWDASIFSSECGRQNTVGRDCFEIEDADQLRLFQQRQAEDGRTCRWWMFGSAENTFQPRCRRG